tara:strand:- start:668 stop:3112 length:2445 start_codon:yes stop_codon:yes gene_type:complete
MQKEVKTKFTFVNKNPKFKEIFKKLVLDKELKYDEKVYILSTSILFLKQFEKDNRYLSYADFAYYIILKYSIKYKDYEPLFDFSINFGFYPISKAILNNKLIEIDTINNILQEINLNKFKNDENYIETLEQNIISNHFLNDESKEKGFLAPTSFGKSSLIIKLINSSNLKKTVVVVPTKSLLMQTYNMIRKANLQKKIIIHEEMYNNETSFIAIFTQERALRLLNRRSLSYDMIIIDEAHNILKSENRSILISRLLSKNKSINKKQNVVYLSPLVKNIENLKIDNSQVIKSHSINFNIKEPQTYEVSLKNKVTIYNRFVNEFYKIDNTYRTKFEYIIKNSKNKNFLYNYRPKFIEDLAKKLSSKLEVIDSLTEINKIITILKREIHPKFYGIDYLSKGIVYIHGKLPDLIKEYLEHKYRTLPEIKYIIANSVILEGINLPIDSLFILNTRGLQGKELINLLGRVNRLNEVFSKDKTSLKKLLPPIHFINNKIYNGENSNMSNKIKLLRSRIFEDEVENPILESYDIENIKGKDKERKKEKIEEIQSNEAFLIKDSIDHNDKIKKYLLESTISDIYINLDTASNNISSKIKSLKISKKIIWKNLSMMEKIDYFFLSNIENINDFEITRLAKQQAQNYYENYILISQQNSLKENIIKLVDYYKERIKSGDSLFYMGRSYGEIPRSTSNYSNYSDNVYVDLKRKNETELVNLSVVKLKMEDDFISYKLNRFIVMLHDLKLIDNEEYNKYIYGTTDEKKISLTKYGMSISLVTRIESNEQLNNIYFDDFNNLQGNKEFKDYLNQIDDLYRFEIERFLN